VKFAAALLVILNAALLAPAASEYQLYIIIGSLVMALAVLAVALTAPAPIVIAAPAPPPANAVKPVAAAVPENRAQAEVVTMLGIFQEKGRLIDFLMEDITPYSDTEVGTVARAVHQGCKSALKEHFAVKPISTANEGEIVTVPVGYSADEWRLVGNLAGEAPFTGKLVHRGWRTDGVKLPRAMKADRLPTIAPAQVEVQKITAKA
jgi:hypothetical protein